LRGGKPQAQLLLAMRRAIATRPAEYRAMVTALKKGALELDAEGRMKRTPRGFDDVMDDDLVAAIRSRHFVVRHEIDPAGIHTSSLVDELLDFTLRAKPLLDWGRSIEGSLAGS
jgi:uncharacterized protein (TIGR02453 family)